MAVAVLTSQRLGWEVLFLGQAIRTVVRKPSYLKVFSGCQGTYPALQ